jgi:hydroxymethylpyrimidine/phosphomethylpyrimidine kinase
MTATRAPVAVTIAGSDSGGGAGIQADLKAFSALGVYGASVITALTAQNTLGVQAIHGVPAAFIAAQIDSVFTDIAVDAVKIGMLAEPAVIETVAAGLARHSAQLVVLDPVMVAASGDRLIAPEAVETLRQVLIPHVALITPNLPEAAVLLDRPVAHDEAGMRAQIDALMQLGAGAVLLKGGHADGPESVDLLATPAGVTRLVATRIATKNSHGTGCTLSAAIAAGLAKGMALETAVGEAKRYVTAAIAASNRLGVGHGRGPTHHFHAWW